jgi:fructosamine-3-kinase
MPPDAGEREQPDWRTRAAAALGPLHGVAPLGGGAYRLQARGRTLVAKVGEGVGDEADGLRQLGAVPGAPPVPEVVHLEAGLLVTTLVPREPRQRGHDVALGRSLATLHAAAHATWGGGSSWIGACPVDPAVHDDAPSFYGARLRQLARRCGLERDVDPVAARLGELLPTRPPSLLHGDLWWGNVVAGADGRAWLIDPSVHGGHPEEDLAMLGLFGWVSAPLLDAYREVLPLESAWRTRVALFQLVPLLVHTVLFGGAYRAQAMEVARRYA